jgi:hypothetical protein
MYEISQKIFFIILESNFKKNDFQWLWMSSLLWDKIYRIGPDDYKLNECKNNEELCSNGGIAAPLSPNIYSK